MVNPLFFKVTSLLIILVANLIAQSKNNLLSNLVADKDTPIYTTYAASMERSEFTLDEGYHFQFYDSSRGLDFITDTGGDICLAFRRGADYVYELTSLFQQPTITVNYPDMVVYHYFPYPEIRVDGNFLVYSSSTAIFDLKISNVSQSPQNFETIPFIQNRYRVFNEVSMHQEKNAVSFTHEELPDSWVLGHDIPYVNPVKNVFISSLKPDRLTSYRSYKWGNIPIPQEINIMKKPVFWVFSNLSMIKE